jgi:hypothetical protein
MSAASGRWRRIAVRIVGHASWVLPGARSDWAEAMRREIDYIEDDEAALRWAVGCVAASYTARLAALAQLRWRVSPGPVAAASALLLVAMALQGHASDDDTPPPAFHKTGCAPLNEPPGMQRSNPDGLHPQAEEGTMPCSRDGREPVLNGRRNRGP